MNEKLKILIKISEADKVVELSGDNFIFGRSSNSSVCLEDPALSRSHFKIFSDGNGLWIEDLNSSNGTFVNGIKLIPNKKISLKIADKITISNTETNVKILAFETAVIQENDLSEQIIEVANLNIEKILTNAKVKADELLQEARENAVHEFDQLRKENSIIIEKEKENKIQVMSEEVAQMKLGSTNELNLEISSKRKEMLNQIELEREKNTADNEKLKSDLKNEIEKIEVLLKNKKNEFSELENDFKKNTELLNQEVGEKIAIKRKELEELEINVAGKKADLEKSLTEEINTKKAKLVEDLNLMDLLLQKNSADLQKTKTNLELQTEELGIINRELGQRRTEELEVKSEIEKLRELQAKIKTNYDLAIIENENVTNTTNSLTTAYNSKAEEFKLLEKDHEKVLYDLSTFSTNKNNLLKECEAIEKNLKDLKIKSAQESEEASSYIKKKENDKQSVQNAYLVEKSKLEEEMRKLRESEEARLQELVRVELGQINKIKEDSLRLVLDLEESITKELSLTTSKVFAQTIGVEKFREIAPEYEKRIKDSLQAGVLKLLKNELTPNTLNKDKRLSSNKNTTPFVAGFIISAIGFGVIPYALQYIKDQNDPARIQKEREELLAKNPVKKFQAIKTANIGTSFANSVIYTLNYSENISNEKFRSDLMKNGSSYLYKQWQIEEEKSIQSYSMIFSMIDSLSERVSKIDPENEKRDIDKMLLYEKETLKKLEVILGNEVRLEAAIKFLNRYYLEYQFNKN